MDIGPARRIIEVEPIAVPLPAMPEPAAEPGAPVEPPVPAPAQPPAGGRST